MAKTNPFGLTDQMFLFCQEYVTRGFKDATGAYRAAYPKCSEKSAAQSASRTLKNIKVAGFLTQVQEKAAKKVQLVADHVLAEVHHLAHSDITSLLEWDTMDGIPQVRMKDSKDLPPAVTAAIKKIKTKSTIVHVDDDRVIERVDMELELYDKGSAIDKAMKHLGLIRDRIEHTGPDGGPIEVREVIVELPKATKNGKKKKRSARRVHAG